MPSAHKVYRFRLKPNQEQLLQQFAGARRWTWNWAFAKKQAHYQATGKTYTKKMQEEEQRRRGLPLRSDGLSKLACGATVRPLDQRRVAMKQESHLL
jgi:Helix-turn-helix domain